MIKTIKCNCNDVGVVVLGNYSPSGHNASRIVDNNGIAPTVMEIMVLLQQQLIKICGLNHK